MHLSCRITRSAAHFVRIGDNVILSRGVRIEVRPRPDSDPPVVILEKSVGVQRRCFISARNRIHIMHHVIMGPAAVLMDHSEDEANSANSTGLSKNERRGSIRVEEGCWIGSRARIVSENEDLVIGRNSVIGANCVITHSIPPFSVVMGNPSQIVKHYDVSKNKWVLGSARSEGTPAAQTSSKP
jgi:acetyltransferase-like isoleucine patch superfamily enzyme